jgi:hypothetical protein
MLTRDSMSIHISGSGSQNTWRSSARIGRDALVFSEVELLELTVNCDSAIEGWLILPIADMSPALRF